jgi:hypothetical protein
MRTRHFDAPAASTIRDRAEARSPTTGYKSSRTF